VIILEEEPEEPEIEEPDPDDFLIGYCSPKGEKICLSRADGKFVGEFDSVLEAQREVRYLAKKEELYPSVWNVSERGYIDLIKDFKFEEDWEKLAGQGDYVVTKLDENKYEVIHRTPKKDELIEVFDSYDDALMEIRDKAYEKKVTPTVWFFDGDKSSKDEYVAWGDEWAREKVSHELIPDYEVSYEPFSDHRVILQKCFIPMNDLELVRNQIEICAQTLFNPSSGDIKNRLLFLKEDKTVGSMDCIHTNVCTAELVEIPKELQEEYGTEGLERIPKVISSERLPQIRQEIKPEGHFIMLRSFVGHLAEEGIENSLKNSMTYNLAIRRGEIEPEEITLPDTTQQGLLHALKDASPEIHKNLVIRALDYMTANDPERFELFSQDFGEVICTLNDEDLRRLDEIDGGLANLESSIQDCLLEKRIQIVGDLPNDLILRLAETSNERIKSKLLSTYGQEWKKPLEVGNPKYIGKELAPQFYRALLKNASIETRILLTDITDLPEDLIETLVRDGSGEVRERMACSGDLPIKYFEELSRDESSEVRSSLANSSLWSRVQSPEIEEQKMKIALELARDADPNVRMVIARQPFEHKEIFKILSEDPDPNVRETLVENSWVDAETEKKLARDPTFLVKSGFLTLYKIPSYVGEILVKDESLELRVKLAEKLQKLEVPEKRVLAKDNNQLVREKVAFTSVYEDNVWDILADDPSPNVRSIIAVEEGLPQEYIKKFIRDESAYVRKAVAGQGFLSQESIRVLARDPDAGVRLKVVSLQKIPKDMLGKLARDPSTQVKSAVVLNQLESLSLPAIEALLKDPELLRLEEYTHVGYENLLSLEKQKRLKEESP
jgi:hypothetical protein